MDKLKMSGQDSNGKSNYTYTKLASFGLEFGGVVAIFCYMGYQLDAALNSSPYFLLGGFFLSFIGMLYLAFKQINNKGKQ